MQLHEDEDEQPAVRRDAMDFVYQKSRPSLHRIDFYSLKDLHTAAHLRLASSCPCSHWGNAKNKQTLLLLPCKPMQSWPGPIFEKPPRFHSTHPVGNAAQQRNRFRTCCHSHLCVRTRMLVKSRIRNLALPLLPSCICVPPIKSPARFSSYVQCWADGVAPHSI